MMVPKRCEIGTMLVNGRLLDLSLCVTPDLNVLNHINKFSLLLASQVLSREDNVVIVDLLRSHKSFYT